MAESKLASKLAEIAVEIGSLPKDEHVHVQGTSANYEYDYISEAALMDVIRPALAERGVAVFYSDEIVDRVQNLVVVRVSLTFVDGETGEERTIVGDGEGTDKGDKAASKAKTTATRILLTKTFLQGGGVDAEKESVERESSRGSGGGSGGSSGSGSRPKAPTDNRRRFSGWKDLLAAVDKASDQPDGSAAALLRLGAVEAWQISVTVPADLGEKKDEAFRRMHEVYWVAAAYETTVPDDAAVSRAWAVQWPESDSLAKRAREAEDAAAAGLEFDPDAGVLGDASGSAGA